jgi:hypothetical protein
MFGVTSIFGSAGYFCATFKKDLIEPSLNRVQTLPLPVIRFEDVLINEIALPFV